MTVYDKELLSNLKDILSSILEVKSIKKYEDDQKTILCFVEKSKKTIKLTKSDILTDTELPVKDLSKEFHVIRNIYSAALLAKIKEFLVFLLPEGASTLDVSELYEESYFDRIGKYETPRDYPANYILNRFGLEDGHLFAEGDDVDDPDREWTFSEYDFTVGELEEILHILEAIPNDIKKGFFHIGSKGKVKIARYRHIGYYNDTEDLAYLTGKDTEEIISSMEKNEGHFYTTSDDEEDLTADKLEYDFNDGKYRAANGGQTYSFIRNGKYLVVNEILSILDPAAAFKNNDPDSGTFIDIYVRVDD